VELLQPLTVGNIGFTAWEIFDLFAVDEGNADTGGFEHLEEGNPIDTGRFHNDSGNVVFFEKGDEIDVVIGKVPKEVTSQSSIPTKIDSLPISIPAQWGLILDKEDIILLQNNK